MKYFTRAPLFILFFLVFSYAASLFYTNFVMSKSILYRSETQYESYEGNIDTLILGDSHAQKAVDTEIIKDSFNYATSGEIFFQSYYKFKSIIDSERHQIKNLILPLDLHNFTSARAEEQENLYYWKKFIDIKELAEIKNNKSQVFYDYFIKANFFSYLGELREIIQSYKKFKSKLINGFRPVGTGVKRHKSTKKLRERMEAHFPKEVKFVDEFNKTYFKKIIILAKEKNIKVFLVKYPLTRDYLNASYKRAPVDSIDHELSDFINSFNYDQINILDLREKYAENKNLFYNYDHLNELGARKLSKILAKELNSIR